MIIDDPEEEAFRDLDRRLNGLRSDDINLDSHFRSKERDVMPVVDILERHRQAYETFMHIDIEAALRNLNKPPKP